MDVFSIFMGIFIIALLTFDAVTKGKDNSKQNWYAYIMAYLFGISCFVG